MPNNKISQQTDIDTLGGILLGTDAVPIARVGNTTGLKATMAKITEYVLNSTTAFFGLNTTTRNLGYAIFGYVDPRWYGAFCGSQFNVNYLNEDDAPGIQAALDTGRNVRLPAGTKLANRIKFKADGQTIFYEGMGSKYNSDYPGTAYIFLPSDIWRGGSSPSTSTLTIGIGSKSLTVLPNMPWVVGMNIDIYNDINHYMQGTITSYDSTTGSLVADITRSFGSGSFSSWDVDQSLNCAIDSNGYDNVGLVNLTFRANYYLEGAVAVGNSVGIQSGRGAAFINMTNVAFLNLGNGIGAAVECTFTHKGTSVTSNTIGTGSKSFTTNTYKLWKPGDEIGISKDASNYMNGTVTSYNPATGALVVNVTSVTGSGTHAAWDIDAIYGKPITTGAKNLLFGNVYQIRCSGMDAIGNIYGMLANSTDIHIDNFYLANNFVSGFASLSTGYGLAGEIMNGRVEYNGNGLGPYGNKKYLNKGAGIYYNADAYLNIIGISGDHNRGALVRAGSLAKNLTLSGCCSIAAFYGANAGCDNAHFAFDGVKGLSATGITTYRNGVDTDHVVQFSGSNDFVNWSGVGGASGGGASVGQWATSYFNFITTPTNFCYEVPGVGTKLTKLLEYTETEYSIGNSGTAFTIDLKNGVKQVVTATGNATVTMPAPVAGKAFTLNYLTGAGGFTAAFTGVKWPSNVAPTLTATAARMDSFCFQSDGVNWYGSYVSNYTV